MKALTLIMLPSRNYIPIKNNEMNKEKAEMVYYQSFII